MATQAVFQLSGAIAFVALTSGRGEDGGLPFTSNAHLRQFDNCKPSLDLDARVYSTNGGSLERNRGFVSNVA